MSNVCWVCVVCEVGMMVRNGDKIVTTNSFDDKDIVYDMYKCLVCGYKRLREREEGDKDS